MNNLRTPVVRVTALLALFGQAACSAPTPTPPRAMIAGGDTLTMPNQAAAVVADGIVYTSGIIGMDPGTMRFVSAEIEGQALQAFVNLERTLAAAGARTQDITQLTVYLSRIEHFQPMNEVYMEFMGNHRPARTIVGFEPWDPKFLIQIQAIAHIPRN